VSYYYLEPTAFAKLFVREAGTDALIRLMESVEDNRKLISAATPLEVYAAIRRCERAGAISAENAASALKALRLESARMVQQPLNPGVLETARQLLDRTALRWSDALQLGAALTARDMFPGTAITFVSASAAMLDAAKNEGLKTLDPAREPEPEETAKVPEYSGSLIGAEPSHNR
jgi:predicted nucleic acid-binding protein